MTSAPLLPPSRGGRGIRPGAALRECWREGLTARSVRADLLAGVVVGIVALPLSMALAVAVGVPPQHGLYTAIVAGALVALLGGSRVQVTGPTAAFVVVLAPVVAEHGLSGLLLATMLAGLLQAALGLARAGRLIQLVPYPVTTGFTAGIAVVIALLQLPDFLGLASEATAPDFLGRVAGLAAALPTIHGPEVAVGALTLALLVGWPRINRSVPAPLVALGTAAVLAWLLERWLPGFAVETIRDRFTFPTADGVGMGIPRTPPLPALPWDSTVAGDAGTDGGGVAGFLGLVRELLPSSLAIAMLGAIESLLSAVVADGMTGDTHDPDAELFAQGIGNLVAPLFGGIAATGAIARTATNVRAGARSPLAAVVHALFVLVAMLAFAPVLGYLPMASMAALLLLVAWNMAEVRHVATALRGSPRSDSVVLLSCLALTVLFDMVVAVGVGLVLASVLFMRRMAELSEVRAIAPDTASPHAPADERIVWYEVAGPLFFGAAHRATSALHKTHSRATVVVLDLSAVPIVDATGIVNLRSAIARLNRDGLQVVLTGMVPRVRTALGRAGIHELAGKVHTCADAAEAAAAALRLVESS